MATPRKRYFRAADALHREPIDNHTLATGIRLMGFLNTRWRRDRLTAEEAGVCVLRNADIMGLSDAGRADVARRRLGAWADFAGFSVEDLGGMFRIKWPKFAEFQSFDSRERAENGPKRAPSGTVPTTGTTPEERFVVESTSEVIPPYSQRPGVANDLSSTGNGSGIERNGFVLTPPGEPSIRLPAGVSHRHVERAESFRRLTAQCNPHLPRLTPKQRVNHSAAFARIESDGITDESLQAVVAWLYSNDAAPGSQAEFWRSPVGYDPAKLRQHWGKLVAAMQVDAESARPTEARHAETEGERQTDELQHAAAVEIASRRGITVEQLYADGWEFESALDAAIGGR